MLNICTNVISNQDLVLAKICGIFLIFYNVIKWVGFFNRVPPVIRTGLAVMDVLIPVNLYDEGN